MQCFDEALIRFLESLALAAIAADPVNALRMALLASELRWGVRP